jgi:hypothetical protein
VNFRETLFRELESLADSYEELANKLPDEAFGNRLSHRSNRIGQQMWCVVGARESYSEAIKAEKWQGFDCSLTDDDTRDKATVARALRESSASMKELLASTEWTEYRDRVLVGLLEHEAQHQGQLIRYVYALGYSFPESWVRRWALEE